MILKNNGSVIVVGVDVFFHIKLVVLHLRDVIDLIGGFHEVAEDQVFVVHWFD
tara:strand:+ start:221 stop:379 length:159 start_codon:yes stop_codon:yes gene_type:complete